MLAFQHGSTKQHRVIDILASSDMQRLKERVAIFAALIFELASKTDTLARIDDQIWDAFWKSGIGVSPLAKAQGGFGLSETTEQHELCWILRTLGSADLSVARLFEGHLNAISLVQRYGSTEQIVELAGCVTDHNLAAVWGADDIQGLKLVCEPQGSKLVGRKILSSGAGFVRRPIVTAYENGEQVLCLLQLGENAKIDLSGWQAQGMRSTATGSVDLMGIEIGTKERIGLPGDYMRQPFFSGGAWRFCAAQTGAIERLMDLFRQHLVARDRGADPYQLQRVSQGAASAKTARFWVEEACRRFCDQTADPASVVAFVGLTRMVVERCALDVIECVQRGVGLMSFVRPNPIERICRDLGTYLRQPAPDLAMADAAKELLSSSAPIGDF